MAIFTTPLSSSSLPGDVLGNDKKHCRRFGPCGVGDEAIYLNGRFIDRRYYAVWSDVKRVFKRVAISKGAYTGKGVFGSLPFLVVVFSDDTEHEFPFKKESDVDRMLEAIAEEHPKIPTYSKEAKAKLDAAAAEERARYAKKLSDKAKESVSKLRSDKEFLDKAPSLSSELIATAKQKRIADNFPPGYKAVGAVLAAGGIAAAVYGLIGLITGMAHPYYFIVGGAAAFFMALTSNTMPTKWNSRRYAQAGWDDAVSGMAAHLNGKPDFSLPPQYAHPIVIERTIRVIREGRAETIEEAFGIMKDDLRALNSSVTVSQKEHDEVAAVKPLFLVCDYKDEI